MTDCDYRTEVEAASLKGLTLWQPYAWAMAYGQKTVETRGWSTRFSGAVYITAAKSGENDLGVIYDNVPLGLKLSAMDGMQTLRQAEDKLDFMKIVARGWLVGFLPAHRLAQAYMDSQKRPLYEWDLGDYSEGRFGWFFEDMQRLVKPVTYRGAQRLFNLNPYSQLTHAQVLGMQWLGVQRLICPSCKTRNVEQPDRTGVLYSPRFDGYCLKCEDVVNVDLTKRKVDCHEIH